MNAEGLRLIYVTQSGGVRVFWQLHQTLANQTGMGNCGFFVTNRHEYTIFADQQPDFLRAGLDTLHEWILLEEAHRLRVPDLGKIAEWEREIGDPTLWNALIIDRRLAYKLQAQFVQSYKPAYTHESLLKILQVALERIAAQFDRVRPHALVGLNAVTVYDYLYYLMARQRGVPYFQLKLTRVRNYVSLYTEPFNLSPHIRNAFARMRLGQALDIRERAARDEARKLLAEMRGQTLVYEGAIKKTSGKVKLPTYASSVRSPSARVAAWIQRFRLLATVRDPHYPTPLRTAFHAHVVRPLRCRLLGMHFDVTDAASLARFHARPYALYPLNTEPEVALLAFGRPYRNQIETVRNVAAALPVGWKLVVKEHPNAFGYRSANYYRKLKQIPNVLLAAPSADTGKLIDACALVLLVFGTIGLEAIIKGKPVVIFCETPYGVFPRTMVRYVDGASQLSSEIRVLLDHHVHDETQVEAFLAAHIATGVQVNLFTGLLGKRGRETENLSRTLDEQYVDLANYLRHRLVEECERFAIRGVES